MRRGPGFGRLLPTCLLEPATPAPAELGPLRSACAHESRAAGPRSSW